MAYCSNCGKELTGTFCTHCGHSADGTKTDKLANWRSHYILRIMSQKIKIEGTLWFVIACLQYLSILGYLFLAVNNNNAANERYLSSSMEAEYHFKAGMCIFFAAVALICAVINTRWFKHNLDLSSEILFNPCGILREYEEIGNRTSRLIYGIICCGILGIVAGIYGIMVKRYVFYNRPELVAIENEYYAWRQKKSPQAKNQWVKTVSDRDLRF